MSFCTPCLQVCSIPVCTDEIILGSISSFSTDVYIVVKNKTTGREEWVATQSDSEGFVTLVTAGLGLMPNQSYEFSVLLKSGGATCNPEIVILGEAIGTCLVLLFDNVKGSDGCPVIFESQTLQAVPSSNEQEASATCNFICLLAKEMAVDFSTAHQFDFSFINGATMGNIIPLYIRIDYVSGDYSDGNATLTINYTNTQIFQYTLDAGFVAGVRGIGSITPVNNMTSGALTAVINPSTNPGAVANIYLYGMRI